MAPDRGMALLVPALAPAITTVVLLAWWFPAVLAAYAALGLLVAPQTVLSLAARAEYSPPHTRGSVFVTVAGTKVAFASAGTALAGPAASWGYGPTLIVLAGFALVGAILASAGIRAGWPRHNVNVGRRATADRPDRPVRLGRRR